MSPRRSYPPSAVVLNGRRLQKLPGWAKVLVFRSGKLEYSRSGHRYVSLGTTSSHNASNPDFTGDCAEREAVSAVAHLRLMPSAYGGGPPAWKEWL